MQTENKKIIIIIIIIIYREAATITVQMTSHLNRRAVRPAGLLNEGSIQNA